MQSAKVEDQKILLSRKDLKGIGIFQSNATLIRAEMHGRFPKRIQLSSGLVCWDRAEIQAWIEARKAERDKRVYSDSIF